MLAAGTAAESGGEAVTIHVIDEVRRLKRDFTCERRLLLAHMKYFQSYFANTSSEDEVDISVHCDASVFEWLLAYMADTSKVASLDPTTVVSILISSDFLQMAALVESCLQFLRSSLNQVLRQPIDLECLSTTLVERLAALFTDEELDKVRDKHDKVLGRLFHCKVQKLLDGLSCCVHCGELFTEQQRDETECPQASIVIDFHGNVVARHEARAGWDASSHLRRCSESLGMSWRAIYWRLWSRVQTFYCTACQRHFSGAELEHCLYHPEQALWSGGHLGCYPCCQQPALCFGTATARGCCARDHVVEADSPKAAAALEKLLRHRGLACVPFNEADFAEESPGGSPSAGEEEDGDSGSESADAATGAVYGLGSWAKGLGSARHRVAYCFAPLPEHRLCGRRSAGHRGRRRQRPESRASARGNSAQSSSARDPRPSSSRNRGASVQQRRSQGGLPAAGNRGSARGKARVKEVHQSKRNDEVHQRWPSPAASSAPSFFSLLLHEDGFTPRKGESKLDMLLEDDRRRMDELTDRIRRCCEANAPRRGD